MTARACPRTRASWGRCGAATRSGFPCKRRGDGIGSRCPNHGGLGLGGAGRQRAWSLVVTPGGIRVTPDHLSARGPCRWPQRVGCWVALELVARGRVQSATLYRGDSSRLLHALRHRGVRVFTDSLCGAVLRVRFDASVAVRERELRLRARAERAAVRRGEAAAAVKVGAQ